MGAPLIDEIVRESAGEFDNFRLCSMKYLRETNTCQIYFHYRLKEGQEYRKIEEYAKLFLPDAVRYTFSYARIVDNTEDVVLFVRNFLYRTYKIELQPENVAADAYDVTIRLSTASYFHCSDFGADRVLAEALDDEFCHEFSVSLEEIKEENPAQAVLQLKEELIAAVPETDSVREQRIIRPLRAEKYLGDLVDEPARYISDASSFVEEQAVFCGKIGNFSLREVASKKNPDKKLCICRFTLTDFTGSLPCFSFVSEANRKKYENLDVTVPVCVAGTLNEGYQNSGVEFKISRISYCELPDDFKEVVCKKGAPTSYEVVTPKAYVDVHQENLFDAAVKQTHPYFIGKQFVVFDTETTGINQISDRIIEIACVKIVDGKITEYLHTMVNPRMEIPESATRVNHITDDMVATAPYWEDVVGDIYRFCDGCTLVGHNVGFDLNMLNNTAKQTHYYFENAFEDTLRIAQRKVRDARNYTLGNLLKVFGLVNDNAHRALEDTIATAQLFMKLIEL